MGDFTIKAIPARASVEKYPESKTGIFNARMFEFPRECLAMQYQFKSVAESKRFFELATNDTLETYKRCHRIQHQLWKDYLDDPRQEWWGVPCGRLCVARHWQNWMRAALAQPCSPSIAAEQATLSSRLRAADMAINREPQETPERMKRFGDPCLFEHGRECYSP